MRAVDGSRYAAAIAAAALIAACAPPEAEAPDDGPAAAAPARPDTPPEPAPAPAAAPETPTPHRPDSPPPPPAAPTGDWTIGIVDRPGTAAGVATLAAVRAASHPGYDRVVFEFGEGGLPGYHLEYVDRPVRQCGSGEVVEVAGDGWLEVRMEPARAHDDQGRATVADRERMPALPVLRELELTCDFEAHLTWVLGVSTPNAFRVRELASPPRLVVDVRH